MKRKLALTILGITIGAGGFAASSLAEPGRGAPPAALVPTINIGRAIPAASASALRAFPVALPHASITPLSPAALEAIAAQVRAVIPPGAALDIDMPGPLALDATHWSASSGFVTGGLMLDQPAEIGVFFDSDPATPVPTFNELHPGVVELSFRGLRRNAPYIIDCAMDADPPVFAQYGGWHTPAPPDNNHLDDIGAEDFTRVETGHFVAAFKALAPKYAFIISLHRIRSFHSCTLTQVVQARTLPLLLR